MHERSRPQENALGGIRGVLGRPYIDLEPHLADLLRPSVLAEIDDEISLALTACEPGFSGSALRHARWIAPQHDARTVDAGAVISAFDRAELEAFLALGDDPRCVESHEPPRVGAVHDRLFNRRQMLYLKYRYGVFFPWSVSYELIPGRMRARDPDNRTFTAEARARFPKTLALIKQLPLEEVSYCSIYGLDAYAPGPVHRDCATEEEAAAAPCMFILISPRKDHRSFLWDPRSGRRVNLPALACWYNDRDYHGVEPDPRFRYSLQINGAFAPELLQRIAEDAGSEATASPM